MPKLTIAGNMSELAMNLTPNIYCHMTQMHKLFQTNSGIEAPEVKKPQDQNPKLAYTNLLSKASIQGRLELSHKQTREWVRKLALIVNGKIYFFKGSQYWRARDDGRIERGFPRSIEKGFPGVPKNFDAAIVLTKNNETKIFFFKDSRFWRLDPSNARHPVDDSYPKKIR